MPLLLNILLNIVIGIALSVAGSLIQAALAPKQRTPGVKGSITTGGDEPLSFIVGHYGSAGHLEYAGSWGSAGDTPNAYLTHVISFSDLAVRGFSRFFIYGEAVTLDATPHATLGYPVLEYRKGGKDHLWVRMHLGTDTTADALLLAQFGADPDRPWLSDMIGRGIAYCVFTALVERELFSGFPEYFAEVDGFDLGDPDLDDNAAALVRQVLQGFAYDGDWVWGLQGLPASRTPAANWDAEIAKANLAIDLVAGGTEPQFRAGAEISVDQQPIEVINELLNSCSARIAEIGGVYKILVGVPGGPVVSFTDEDVVISEGQSFEPFPGLEATFNGVNATYPEPAEKWGMKDAPALRDAALEADDDDRRLPATVSFPFVWSGTQVQRLMKAMHLESRRFRTHSMTMPPEWWEYEVLDAAAWSSARNGYVDKLGLITVMDDLPDGNQFIGWKEQDPDDYDWDADTDELPYTTAPLVIARPAPQEMTGWQVFPAVLFDNDGAERRPSIEVRFDGGLVDVQGVRVQVRLSGDTLLAFDGELPYDVTNPSPAVILNGTFLPATDYEVRGKYVPYSGRETEWSDWLAVTTPDVRLGADDIDIELGDIAEELAQQFEWIGNAAREAMIRFRELGTLLEEQDLANFTDRQVLSREIVSKFGEATAGYLEAIEVATGPGSATAQKLETLYASLGGNTALVNVRWEASASPEAGFLARYGVTAAVNDGAYRSASLLLDVPSSPGGKTRLILDADQTLITTDGGTNVEAMFDADGAVIRDLRVGTIEGPGGTSFWNLSTGAFRVSGGS